MKIKVLSGQINVNDVVLSLLDSGLVVLETTRPEAKRIHEQTIVALGIDDEKEEGPHLLSLSTEAGEGGWSTFFVYTERIEYDIEKIKFHVRAAVAKWIEAGSPNKFTANIMA